MVKRCLGDRILSSRASIVIAAATVLLAAVDGSAIAQGPGTTQDQAAAAAAIAAAKDKHPPLTEDNEVKLGRANAEENDKHVQLVTDAAVVGRVNRIGKEIAEAANSYPIKQSYGYPWVKKFNYTFKVVNDKDVNAYSLPGGFIYVNKGLLDYVRSDDELAGVLAHEVSHAAHHHMVKLMKDQNNFQNILIPALAGLVVATHARSNDVANILNGGYLVAIARANTWSVSAEQDADHSGILLLTHTHFNPVGLYSFMIRMAADEDRKNFVDMGILRTHPPGAERVDAARQTLEELHIPIELSKVDPTLLVSVKPVKGATAGVDLAEMSIRSMPLCRITAAEGKSAADRAADIASKINKHIDQGLQPFDVRLGRTTNKVYLRDIPLFQQVDADVLGKSLDQLKQDLVGAIMLINQKMQLDAPHQ